MTNLDITTRYNPAQTENLNKSFKKGYEKAVRAADTLNEVTTDAYADELNYFFHEQITKLHPMISSYLREGQDNNAAFELGKIKGLAERVIQVLPEIEDIKPISNAKDIVGTIAAQSRKLENRTEMSCSYMDLQKRFANVAATNAPGDNKKYVSDLFEWFVFQKYG